MTVLGFSFSDSILVRSPPFVDLSNPDSSLSRYLPQHTGDRKHTDGSRMWPFRAVEIAGVVAAEYARQ